MVYLKKFNLKYILSSIRQRALFSKLTLLLICIALTTLLMQAGSLFLLDYMRSSQAAISKVNEHRILWEKQLFYINHLRPADSEKILKDMRLHYLDTKDPEVRWMLNQDSDELARALQRVEQAQQRFDEVAVMNVRIASQLRLADRVLISYQDLVEALASDGEIKRSVISLLNIMSLLFLYGCIIAISLASKKLLVDRMDRLQTFLMLKFPAQKQEKSSDEFTRLEQRIFEMTARIEGYRSQVAWAEKTNEKLLILLRSHEFILKFIEITSNEILTDKTLLKLIYSLERAMNFDNVAIIQTEDAAVISGEHVIYSHHPPPSMTNERFDELHRNGMSSYLQQNHEQREVRCIGVTYQSSGSGLGILLIETGKDRLLDNTELQVLEISAKLLSMATKFQNHDEEGRRLAVLEERSAIARELHDSLAQSLSFMKIQLARLQSAGDNPEKSSAMLTELRQGLDAAYRELRELLTTFRVHMDLRGLGYAIQTTLDEFSQRSNVAISFDNRLVNCRLTVNEEFHMLHVVREALSNIVRHSKARHVTILLDKNKSGKVVLTIDDDGIGFTAKADTYDHHGQVIMKERARTLGGELEVMAKRHGGTRVRLNFTPKSAQ
ncbi:histidine kinase [Methylophaga lonarensis MPL]|uniref:Sensor protein n=2 Tax=Methylophaga lonarensis TaxID=999151 RepID=M7P213_9GAMM|nr:histidine kinase [Methylophaga lonarensis MPL]